MPEDNTKSDSLSELKRLTMGNSLNEPVPPTQKTQKPEEKPSKIPIVNDLEAFKEEQRIFTQISSIKEIQGEQNYSVPKELSAPKVETSGISAFEKLKTMAEKPIIMDEKKETISSPDFSKQIVFQEKIIKSVDPNTGTIVEKSSLDKKPVVTRAPETKKEPVIQKPKEERITSEINVVAKSPMDERKEMLQANQPMQTPTGEKKDITYDWMKQEEIEEPNPEDFIDENETFFSRQKELIEEQKRIEEQLRALRTPVDEIFEMLEKYNKIDSGELAGYLKLDYDIVEKIGRMFENDGVLEIDYPTSLTKKPIFILKKPVPPKMAERPKGEIIEAYKLTVDSVQAQISIILTPGEARPTYSVQMPSIGNYTRRFLFFIKEEVAENMPIELEDIVDPKKSKKLKERFFNELNTHLSSYFPSIPIDLLNMLSGVLLHEMYGLGDIEIIMGDDMLEEVAINSAKTPITIYHRVHGWLKTNLLPGTEEDINNFSSQIGRKVGREITVLNPILDAHLLSGDRVNATLFPITAEGNTLTIRRFARKPWTIIDFIGRAHTMNSEMAAMLWLAMQYELNILIAGGTASGKTSALNSLLALVPTYHRILSIEDVREIVLPKYLEWNWVPMVTRSPNPEGLGEVTMLDLMLTSLRMRPDRIIVGEIRRKKEAEVLMEAIETGHSIYSTLHANSGYQVLRRLAEPPINIPLMQIELLDIVVVQYRDRKTNRRRTYEIAEIEQTSTGQGLQINTIYKWIPRTDSWERLNKPTKLITLLNLHTGMTEEDIFKEIEDRKQILDWMKRINLTELDTIGFLVKLFYSNPERIKKIARQNVQQEEIIKLMETEQGEETHTPKDVEIPTEEKSEGL